MSRTSREATGELVQELFVSFSMINIKGQQVYRLRVINEQLQIGVEHLSSGFYMLKLVQGNKLLKAVKMIKKNKLKSRLELTDYSFLPHKIRFQLLQHRILLAQITDYLTLFQEYNAVAEVGHMV